jgi:ABC-type amino acid transport substrate-binding protein
MQNKHLFGSGVALLVAACLSGTALAGGTFDRVRDSGHLRLAYLPNAAPFTDTAGGNVEGYGAALCQEIATRLKAQLAMPDLAVDWVPVTMDTRFTVVMRGQADVLCTPAVATLERRKALAFSLPVFAGGLRAVVRSDAPTALRDVLEATPAQRNVWRGSPSMTLIEKTRFAVVAGTTAERLLATKVASFKLNTATVSVPDHASGIKFLLERKIDVFLAERELVLPILDDSSRQKVAILKRQFTHDPLGLGLPRDDDDFRLFVDSVLSATYASADFPALYSRYFQQYDELSRTFFTWNTLSP